MAAGSTYWFTPEQLQKIIDRIEPQDNGCWWYPAKRNHKGYAVTRIGWPIIKGAKIHRLSWIYYKGDIPEGMVLDHTCHDPKTCIGGDTCEHRRCVNPNHLQLVSASENNSKTVRVLKFKNKCKNGHILKDNIYQYNSKQGKRSGCAICMNRKVQVG
jgi:hypothetical protein